MHRLEPLRQRTSAEMDGLFDFEEETAGLSEIEAYLTTG